MATAKPANVELIIKDVRLSFPNLFKPKKSDNDKGDSKLKYSASFIFDKKKDAAQIKQVEAAIQKAWLETFGPKAGRVKKHPLRDGIEYEDKDGYGENVMFISAKNDRKPVVVDGQKQPLAEASGKPYAGCYVNAKVRFYGFDHATGGKQVCCSLEVVQFKRDGEPFGAGAASLDDMPEEEGDTDLGLDDDGGL